MGCRPHRRLRNGVDLTDRRHLPARRNEVSELARRLAMGAAAIGSHARDHQAAAAGWRHAARTAGIRRPPTP
ncbi:hypothetical protein [Nonomuraea dietziae]|uniref:hypothetical protein n=1 Tax=Nonomuraea dietziae TaxID=65515 RepID=UPI003409742F